MRPATPPVKPSDASRGTREAAPAHAPEQTLVRRLATGEISIEEYRRQRAVLDQRRQERGRSSPARTCSNAFGAP